MTLSWFDRVIIISGAIAALTVVLKFGFLDSPNFTETVSMKGKTVAITGGNTGLGKEAAIRLASLGAHIIILSRASSKTDQAVEEIKRLSGRNGSVESIPLDLADLSNVRQCGATLRKRINSLDVLMNNAGIMAVPTRQVPISLHLIHC